MSEEVNKAMVGELIDKMAESWPSEFIARKKIEEYTGGLITGKTIANFESKGEGPPKIKLGRLAGYVKQPFNEWLKSRIVVVKPRPVRQLFDVGLK